MASKKLYILCFGNSLTAGYYNMGLGEHPYAIKLAQTVTKMLPDYEVETVVEGRPGDMVLKGRGAFLQRMQEQFADDDFDWTIVLGGTNDLARGGGPEKIFADLLHTYSVPLEHGSKVLALTVPETGTKVQWLSENRSKLNDLIKQHKAKNFHVFDFNEAFPYWKWSAADRKRYYDDAVHFTPDGYDLMGERVGAALAELLAGEKVEVEKFATV
ncbi:SGNH hydrolase [Myriangium duriaei CBS 260.36]|uniref:SGNH hydrolase n=1 Tax=Myriangium duriaei CBS 260.36 TaxID=1168546 RepID=A0A9P4JEB5_9PEZI|nr:SGNH hydrolase [Myriangium duriaei CBS 260.36]